MSPLDLLTRIVLGAESGHLPIALAPAPRARVLYRPGREVREDERSPHAWTLAGTDAASVGLAIADEVPDRAAPDIAKVGASGIPRAECRIGLADRYGGAGIGRNGGSGRNALIGGVQVKGIGRTPLVSPDAALSHASGGAYLEECVREAIFTGIVAHDFPYGALPVLEILDTGESQIWPAPVEPAIERRVLLVRPPCVRPAHFERAVAFDPPDHREAGRDHARVSAVLQRAAAAMGADGLIATFEDFWPRWSHQLAYGFVHRLSHGNDTSSNIALDGRLLDFGAASTLPSWACTASSYFHDPIATRFNAIAMAIRSVHYYLGRHLGWKVASPAHMTETVARAAETFRRALVFETLRLCGLPDAMAMELTLGQRAAVARSAVRFAIDDAQQLRLDLLEPVSMAHVDWPMSRLWHRSVPPSLRRLRALLNTVVGKRLREDCEAVHRHRSRTRSELFKPHLRAAFFEAVAAQGIPHGGAHPPFLREFIDSRIQRGVIERCPADTAMAAGRRL